MPFDKAKLVHRAPSDKVSEHNDRIWDAFASMYDLKTRPLEILGGRSLQMFWDQSNKDYAVITDVSDENDPVVQYSSSITRDQADVFIGQLTSQLMYPSVIAQNNDQEIDRIVSKVGAGLVEWLHDNDGYPGESGHQKMVRYIHKMVVEGTIHIMDKVTKEGLESEIVPNEEVFIPNYWQPNIQKQTEVIRAVLNVTYDEAEQMFSDKPNWKYVQPVQSDSFVFERPEFKETFDGILEEDKVNILYHWRRLSPSELKKAKKAKKVKQNVKRALYFNILVNDIEMLPLETIYPYDDGYYPINKGIFAYFAKAEFYWGNSLPNKIAEDKKWIDAWKTLLRYKAKLSLLKPYLVKGGVIDEEIVLPAKHTPIADDIEVTEVPGIEPINSSDISMLQMAEGEVQRGSKSPQTNIDPDTSARAAVIQEANAKVLLNSFALQVIFFLAPRTHIILGRAFAKLPKNKIKKIAIPEQNLPNGKIGTLEVIFEKLEPVGKAEELERSLELFKEEREAEKMKKPKKKVFVDPSYVQNLNLYVKFEAGTSPFGKDELQKAQFNQNLEVYLGNPDLFNRKRAARKFIQINKDDEGLLNEENEGVNPQDPNKPQEKSAPPQKGAPTQLDAGQIEAPGKLPII